MGFDGWNRLRRVEGGEGGRLIVGIGTSGGLSLLLSWSLLAELVVCAACPSPSSSEARMSSSSSGP